MKRSVTTPDGPLEYTLIRTGRRDLLIRAQAGVGVRVLAPEWFRLKDADAAVMEHAGEIRRMLREVQPVALRDGARILLKGREQRLTVQKGRTGVSLGPEGPVVVCPDPKDAGRVRAELIAFLSGLALEEIRSRIAVRLPSIAPGSMPGRVTIRSQRTRWGSCSAKHNLNFNWKLILAPPECLDYVVVHELCHLKEFNHSPRFWSMVEQEMPDYTVWKAWLKKNGRYLELATEVKPESGEKSTKLRIT